MKIAFCLISNDTNNLQKFIDTLPNGMVKGNEYYLCLSLEKNVNMKEISCPIKMKYDYREKEKGLMNYGKARLHSFELANGMDYIIMCDDDFRFRTGTKLYNWTAGERYIDCIEYLNNQSSCAVVYAKGFLGGVPYGRWILPMSGGFYETGLGIVIRYKNRPYKDIIDKQFLVQGAGEDTAIAITAIMNGYYPAKALNTTASKRPTKKVLIKPGKSSKHISDNVNYSLQYINDKGIFSYIAKKYGSYELGKRLPQTIIDAYRENATKLGHIIMF